MKKNPKNLRASQLGVDFHPGLHPKEQWPYMWWQGVPSRHAPQVSEQFRPYVPLLHSIHNTKQMVEYKNKLFYISFISMKPKGNRKLNDIVHCPYMYHLGLFPFKINYNTVYVNTMWIPVFQWIGIFQSI